MSRTFTWPEDTLQALAAVSADSQTRVMQVADSDRLTIRLRLTVLNSADIDFTLQTSGLRTPNEANDDDWIDEDTINLSATGRDFIKADVVNARSARVKWVRNTPAAGDTFEIKATKGT